MNYSVIIPSTLKDFNKISFVLTSLKNYLIPQPTEYIVIYEECSIDICDHIYDYVDCIEEKGVLNFEKITPNYHRPGWIYQQFLKLFNFISDYYLVVDSDLILNRPLNIFHEDGKPFFFLGRDQNHQPYFNYSKSVLGIDRNYNHSFISELMFMQKSICIELLNTFGKHNNIEGATEQLLKTLYYFTCENCNKQFIPGDYEIYGNFIQQFDPTLYHIKKIKTRLFGQHGGVWTDTQIQDKVDEIKNEDCDTFTIHTWI